MRKYSILGKVAAFDPDGDDVVYGLDHPDPCCIVVPQTGEVMLVDPEAIPTQLAILAKEKTNPSRQSRLSTIIGKVLLLTTERATKLKKSPGKKSREIK